MDLILPCCKFLQTLLVDKPLADPSFDNLLVAVALAIGLLWLSCATLGFLTSTMKCLWPATNPRKYGAWAVVTGATDGIGLAYAKVLAKKGLNIVLISRSAERLAEAEKDVKAKAPTVQTRTIQADFSSMDPKLYAGIKAKLEGLDIGILINNVGVSYPSALFFHELDSIDPALIDTHIAVNVNATTQMTRIVVDGMVARKRGAIINVSSAAGRIPTGNPMYAVYSASKAYVDFFSRSLHYELKGKGIHVQCQSPYFVTSKLSKLRKTSLTTPNPDAYAAAAVKAIGCGDSVVPYWSHAIQDKILRVLPRALLGKLLMSMHLGIRASFMKKRAAEKKD